MDRCPVCGRQDFDGLVCPSCGYDESRNYQKYPSLESAEGSKSVSALRRQWQERQALRYRQSLRIVVQAPYVSFDEESGSLSYDHTEQILIATGGQLKENEIIWSAATFVPIDGMQQLPIRLLVENESGSREYRVTTYAPTVTGPWRVGVKLSTTAAMDAQLAVGAPKNHELSESFALKF